ncbi:MAG: BatA domain-containing protein [Isosphaeraceae bacterium]
MGAFLHPAMLVGLAGLAIPIVIHLLNRRRLDVVDWGAMQFLELGRRARRRFELTEALLMAARMLLLALVALALARPFLAPRAMAGSPAAGSSAAGGRRDLVLILDDSASMGRRGGDDATPRQRAIDFAGRLIRNLPEGSSVALLLARDRARPLLDAPSFDPRKVITGLERSIPGRGSGDLPAALNEAFRLLESAENPNPARDVVILTDGQRFAWRPGEAARWGLLREIWARSASKPGLGAVLFPPGPAAIDSADFRASSPEPSRDRVAPGLAVSARAEVVNDGPGSAARAAEWLVDGRVVSTEVIGPLSAGGKAVSRFHQSPAEPGSHVLTFRPAPDDADPQPADDEASRPIERAAHGVLLVEGEPGRQPLGGRPTSSGPPCRRPTRRRPRPR